MRPVATIPLERVRAICLALPETHERVSHGAPSFFVGSGKGKQFAMHHDDHHGDGRLAVWVAAPEGAQEALVDAAPEHYFRPPYVGHRGWIGVHLDHGIDEDELADVLEDGWVQVAPRRLTRDP